MSAPAAGPSNHPIATALAWIIGGAALFAATVLEFSQGADLRGDGDNPADSLVYLAAAGRSYLWSGAMVALGGAALVVGAVGRMRARSSQPESMLSHVSLVFAIAGSTLLIGAGVLRMQATGTVPHIASLDRDWGEAAYLAVQMAGTQGLLSAGTFILLGVTMGLSIAEWREGMRAAPVAAVVPATALVVLLGDLVVPAFESLASESLFLVYVASALIGVPLWCGIYGASQLLRVRRRATAGTAAVGAPPVC